MATVKQYQGDPRSAYYSKVSGAESGGKNDAKNPNGSALGQWQFVEKTWEGLNKKYNLGYTLEDRKNPEKAKVAMELFTKENENIIQPVLGREINDTDRYLGHFLGGYGAKTFLQALNDKPDLPVNLIVSPNVMNSNKNVLYNNDGSPKTVSQVYGWAQSKMGGTYAPQEPMPIEYQDLHEYYKPQNSGVDYIANPELFAAQEKQNKERSSEDAKNNLLKKQQEKEDYKNQVLKLIQASQVQYVEPESIDISPEDQQFQSGGTVDKWGNTLTSRKIYNENIDRSYYDSRTNSFILGKNYINSSPEEKQKTETHENFHRIQHETGRDNFDIAQRTNDSFSAFLTKKPQLPTTNEVYYNYYNRAGVEAQMDINNVIKNNPELQFLPEDIIFDKIVDDRRYDNPYSFEGEAQEYERTGVYQSGGKIKLKDERLEGAVINDNIPKFIVKEKELKEVKKAIDDKKQIVNTGGLKNPKSAMYSSANRENFPDEKTKQFFEKIRKEYGEGYYQQMLDIQAQSGNPSVDLDYSIPENEDKDLSGGREGRSHYNPFINTMTLKPNFSKQNPFEISEISKYASEAAHAYQFNSDPSTNNYLKYYITKDIPANINSYLNSNTDLNAYETKGTVENEAHTKIEPAFSTYIYNFPQKVPEFQSGGQLTPQDISLQADVNDPYYYKTAVQKPIQRIERLGGNDKGYDFRVYYKDGNREELSNTGFEGLTRMNNYRVFIEQQRANQMQLEQNPSTVMLQEGGQIPISPNGVYEYPNQTVIVPTDGQITMQNVNYPILGKSLESGEEKMMYPNQEYYFKNTETVLEKPILTNRRIKRK